MNPQNPAPLPPAPAEPDSTPLKTDIVSNIPMHQAEGPPTPVKDGDDLDKIMQDVGHELKKDDKKPAGHHLFSKKHDEKLHSQPDAAANQPHPLANTGHQPPVKSPAKPKSEHRAPVGVIVVTILVTLVLIGVTYSVYSK